MRSETRQDACVPVVFAKKRDTAERCPLLPTASQFLFVFVQPARAKFLALRNRTYGPRGCYCRSSSGGSVTFQEHWNHGAFGFLDERQLVFADDVDADKVPQLY